MAKPVSLAAQIPEVQFVIPDWCRMRQQNVTTDWSTVTDKPEIGVVTTGVLGSLLFFALIYGKLLKKIQQTLLGGYGIKPFKKYIYIFLLGLTIYKSGNCICLRFH